MIKKLRRKFVIINMLFVFVVLLCVFVAVFISSSQNLTNDIHRSLIMAANDKSKYPKHEFGNGELMPDDSPDSQEKDPKFISVYSFCMTDDGYPLKTIQANNLLDDSEITEIARLIAEEAYDEVSILKEYNLYYYKHSTANGNCIVSLADAEYYYSSISSMILSSLAIGSLSLIAFFFISLFLSRWALKPVEDAWEQQKQFIADASHELKTPLTVILANSKILLSKKSNKIEDQLQWIESTQAEAQNMKELVESLLFLARSDAQGEQTKTLSTLVSLSELTESTALQFEPVAYEKKIDLQSEIEENITVQGDLSQLKQLIQILLDNACKYTSDNGTVIITLRKNTLSVFNSGEPIPKENLPHLFERFYRSDTARSDSSSFGLGLSIAKTIALNHGGDLCVESNSSIGGTVFTFSFS